MEERGETGRRGGKGDTEAEIGDGPVDGPQKPVRNLEIKLGGGTFCDVPGAELTVPFRFHQSSR